MVMHKQQFKVFQSANALKHNFVSSLALAGGVAISLGFINIMPLPTHRFQFQQQIGDHQLSGVFEGTDKNANGLVELSELDSFEASWGDYSWTKEDLEVFSWGEKAISQNQGKVYGIEGLNFFARSRQQLKSQALQVWNRQVSTPEGSSENQGVYGIEYAANTPDNTLFSQDQLPLVVNPAQSPTDVSVLMMLLLVGSAGLLVLNPCFYSYSPDGKPCSSQGKI